MKILTGSCFVTWGQNTSVHCQASVLYPQKVRRNESYVRRLRLRRNLQRRSIYGARMQRVNMRERTTSSSHFGQAAPSAEMKQHLTSCLCPLNKLSKPRVYNCYSSRTLIRVFRIDCVLTFFSTHCKKWIVLWRIFCLFVGKWFLMVISIHFCRVLIYQGELVVSTMWLRTLWTLRQSACSKTLYHRGS